ncbi:branched-chain amino acid transport system permease protein [Lutimaribacter pacificus]|uniref:Amino acid/amide ABC transporter membrane protein 1, HAAT family n=1 Tax=Lutimaribacter pacificus TaxID=391948 RepID=A0A1H0D179_9RHOB|nr:branched-chain amino acid ABC transporter permease [Lutimaribacter pacificus]SDN63849.1 branched-chain amino acid transport system permease protein [Lutimaribacter pacificus]SHJ38260.1 amino acid/amide ABC transporter membrane protein 1, HAAT family [Lutimaribacter pacificus]
MEVLQLLISGMANGCVYGLVALGFVLIYKATEAVNFAQGDFMMLGAFVTLGLVNPEFMGLNFWVALPIVFVIMGVFGYLLDLVVLRALFGQNQVAVIILTIALGFILRFVAGLIWGHEPLSLHSPLALGDLRMGTLVLGMADVAIIIVTFLLTLFLWQFFQRTKVGLAMQAASQNQMAAYYMGIPVKRVQGFVWALAGIVAAIAGILYASKGAIDPNAGFIGIKAFAAAVIGGFGSLPGALMGGLIVGIIEPFAARYLPAGWSQIAPYALLIGVLLFRPHGLFAQVRVKKV